MSYTTIQNSLAAGELSPSLFGRTDLGKYHSGTSTCRNFFVNYRGGVVSRAGLAYVGTCKQPGTSNPPRDIPFQFSITQGYVLEFGDSYMRVKTDGGYVLEATKNISGITQANPAVLNIVSHGYSVNDWIYITNVGGMTEFNSLVWIVHSVVDANHIQVTDLYGTVVNSSTFTAYTSGGTAARLYTVVAPYAAVDLPYLKYTQSADTMTLTCVNTATNTEYPSYELKRVGATNWTFTIDSFSSTITAPNNVTATASSSSSLSTWYSYVVTAVDATTGEESVASSAVYVENNDISVYRGSNTITWDQVSGAGSYNIYKATPSFKTQLSYSSLYGFAGSSSGSSFTDSNITADSTIVPPVHQNPFVRIPVKSVTITAGGTNYSQSTVGYTVSTFTGSGFSGTPVVVNGSVVDFVISNHGANYFPGDGISFTDSGGGVATGNFLFTANPSDSTNIYLNGYAVEFVNHAPAADNQVTIAGSLALTMQALANFFNSSNNVNLTNANYTSDSTHLYIAYLIPGTAGNSFTISVGAGVPATASGATLTGGGTAGSGAFGSMSFGPATGTYPSVCSYFDQRRVYASTLNNPDKYWMSQPGLFSNMDSSVPVTDADALSGTPWSQQVNGIQWLVPMPGGLVVLTGKGAWQLNGGANTAITPANQVATPQAYNGCNNLVPPITINYDILYVQAKGSIVRDLSYNFFVNIYTGTDLTVLSNHLFNGYTVDQWAWAEEPYKLVWVVRNDGTMLCLTYLKEQEVYAWTRHDTNGLFVSVCSVTEPPVDAVYVITKRYVQGAWRYYSERMNNRIWNNVEDSFCVDSGLTNTINYPSATLTPAAATGTANLTSTVVIDGGSGYTSPTVVAVDATGAGTGATFSATLSSGVITAITSLTSGTNYTVGQTTLKITDSTGSGAIAQPVITNNVTFIASSSVFTAGNVGDIIRVGGGKATVVTYNSGTSVIANITQDITDVITDDPNNLPVPAISGSWSISTPITTVSGLNHLEGLEVAILADGGVVSNQTVTNNSITLAQAASKIVIGLPYTCQVQTMYLDMPGEQTPQNKRKLINSVGIRLEETRGVQIGADQVDSSTQPNYASVPWSDMNEVKERTGLNALAGSAVPLYTGDYFKNISSGWAIEGQIAVQQVYPLPATILALIAYWNLGDSA